MDKIWVITTYERIPERQIGGHLIYDRRTVGWFKDQQTAVKLVLANGGDLEEAGWYRWAVVEPIGWGLYPINRATDRLWFEYVRTEEDPDGRWVPLTEVTNMAPIDTPSTCPQEILDQLQLGRDRFCNWSTIG